jgi:anti-sigma factor (TIGR02949 family)
MTKDPTRPHTHTQCRQLLGSLSEYVDGELDEELCSALEQHLEGCEDCRIVVDTLRKTVYLYHATTNAEDIPSDIRERLFKSLNIEEYLKK